MIDELLKINTMVERLLQLVTIALIAFVYFQVTKTTKEYTTEVKGYAFELANQKVKYDSLGKVKTIIEDQLSIQSNNVIRYEIALDSLKSIDSVAAIKFRECLDDLK